MKTYFLKDYSLKMPQRLSPFIIEIKKSLNLVLYLLIKSNLLLPLFVYKVYRK